MSNTNISDRKIIDTGRGGSALTSDYRLPEVQIVGAGFDSVPGDVTPSDPPANVSPTPTVGIVRNMAVEEQRVRISPDGSAVVDVVLSFDAADGAAKHELRISKI
jgi:hypothetical protein